jgi:Icc-related predicted phosphoesterase
MFTSPSNDEEPVNVPPPPSSILPPPLPSAVLQQPKVSKPSDLSSALAQIHKQKHAPPPPPPSTNSLPPPPMVQKTQPPPKQTGTSLQDILAQRKQKKQPIQLSDLPIGITDQEKQSKRKLRIVIMSDTHLHHNKIVPDGDILLHCGDMTNTGHSVEVDKFNNYLKQLPHKHKIIICGNHEEKLSHLDPEEIRKRFSAATAYLHDSSIIVEGIKIYGSPYVKNMSYYEPWMKVVYDDRYFYRNEEELEKLFAKIEPDIDILMTHGPPFKIQDGDIHGSHALRAVIDSNKLSQLKLSCFGHVHPMYGHTTKNKTLFVNAALDDDEQPFYLDYYTD